MKQKKTQGAVQLLRVVRSEKGAQAKIARALGTSDANIHRWARGQAQPQIAAIMQLAAVCGIPPEAWAAKAESAKRTKRVA